MVSLFCMQKFTFNKEQKLCSKILIDNLFSDGKRFKEGFIRVVHRQINNEEADFRSQVLISVSKRNVKKASKRNPIKRRIREAYRLHKNELLDVLNDSDTKISIAIIYQSSESIEYKRIEDKIILSLQRLAKVYGKSNENVDVVTD